MADTQILPLGLDATPASYTVKGSQAVTIGSIFANYNGAAAAGSFIPTVEILSDSGNTILEVPQDTTVTAGDTAKASWAPFLRTAAAATGSPYAFYLGPSYITLVNAAYTGVATNLNLIETSHAAIFSVSGGIARISANGVYQVFLDVEIENGGGGALTATQVQLRNIWENASGAQLGVGIYGAAGLTEMDTSSFGTFGGGTISNALVMHLTDAATFGPFKALPDLFHNHGSNGKGFAAFAIVKVA